MAFWYPLASPFLGASALCGAPLGLPAVQPATVPQIAPPSLSASAPSFAGTQLGGPIQITVQIKEEPSVPTPPLPPMGAFPGASGPFGTDVPFGGQFGADAPYGGALGQLGMTPPFGGAQDPSLFSGSSGRLGPMTPPLPRTDDQPSITVIIND